MEARQMNGIREYLARSSKAVAGLDPDEVARAAEVVLECIASGGTVFLCGNGGSAADSLHLAAEFTGRFLLERPGMRAVALTDNCAALTAIANDYGYVRVFSRQIEALGRPGDLLWAISTSGTSPSILAAADAAHAAGMKVLAFTGNGSGGLAAAADASVTAPAGPSCHVQEALLAAGHAICMHVEKAFPENKA
jgi:D-sedoheptulose 7-phosphate isomerase